jgi:hypothetical protein
MKIAPGTILMKEGTHLPESVRVSRKASWSGWIAIKSLDPRGLDKQLREVGWTFHFLASSVRKRAFGFDSETRFDRAMSSAIKYVQAEKCNCVEFDQTTEKSIFGLPYTSVSIHSRHIQEGLRLNNR